METELPERVPRPCTAGGGEEHLVPDLCWTVSFVCVIIMHIHTRAPVLGEAGDLGYANNSSLPQPFPRIAHKVQFNSLNRHLLLSDHEGGTTDLLILWV